MIDKKRPLRKSVYASVIVLAMIFTAGCANKNHKESAVYSDSTEEAINDTTTQQAKSVNTAPITIAMVGDIMMGTTHPKTHPLPEHDGDSLFKDVKDLLRSADIAAGNLEGSLFDGEGTPKKCGNPATCFTFKMPERYVKHLVDAGFDFLSVANNHINDFGPDAKAATQRVLSEAGLQYAGDSEKKPTAILEKDGRKIGYVAFGFDSGMPSINDYQEVRKLIGDLKKECDFVIVSFHGGGEGENYQHVPHKREITSKDRGNVEEFAHVAVDAGADVIYGHSPHVNRAVELYKNHIIFYSLGNFCTPYWFNLASVRSYAPVAFVKLNPDGTFAEGQIHSFIQQRGTGPRKDKSNRAALKIRELTKSDFPNTPLQIADDGKISVVK